MLSVDQIKISTKKNKNIQNGKSFVSITDSQGRIKLRNARSGVSAVLFAYVHLPCMLYIFSDLSGFLYLCNEVSNNTGLFLKIVYPVPGGLYN